MAACLIILVAAGILGLLGIGAAMCSSKCSFRLEQADLSSSRPEPGDRLRPAA